MNAKLPSPPDAMTTVGEKIAAANLTAGMRAEAMLVLASVVDGPRPYPRGSAFYIAATRLVELGVLDGHAIDDDGTVVVGIDPEVRDQAAAFIEFECNNPRKSLTRKPAF